MKVVFWPEQAKAEMLERFETIADVELAIVEDAGALVAALPEAQVLVLSQTAYNRGVADAVREHGKNLRFIQLINVARGGLVDQDALGMMKRNGLTG